MQHTKKIYLLMRSIIKNNGIVESEFADYFCQVLTKTTKKVLDIDASYTIDINDKTKDLFIFILAKVVSDKTKDVKLDEINLKTAIETNPSAKIGDMVKKIVNFDDFSHYFVQYFRQFLTTSLYDVKHKNDINKANKLLHTVIWAELEELHFNKAIIVYDFLRMILPKKNWLKSETFQPKKFYYFYVEAIEHQDNKLKIILSRTAPELVAEILKKEIPEIETSFIEIKHVVRCPDEKSKVIVASSYSNIDPVGACIGPQAQRLKNVSQYINSERIDFVEFVEDEKKLISNFFNNVTIYQILPLKTSEYFNYFSETDKLGYCIIVDKEDFGKALGKRYINNRLLDKLLGTRNLMLTLEDAIDKKFISSDFFAKKEKENDNIVESIQFEAIETEQSNLKTFEEKDDNAIDDKYKNIIHQYLVDEDEEDIFNLDAKKQTPDKDKDNELDSNIKDS
ncbi:NusA N-terminal domain-containing protein [Mycoplasma sp. SG1]|uniref:NusA N-terminal domain-containing protein n=1 Tax=Mycoplasma sp. SG1 TaxID=2810348 RepID=UPI0020245DD9|nr:NusA N-terminal domain-containing protein [Mycoplasma sp. SG1]URM53224.1 hypothetical protein JRW51_02660 [Mycoplasma sp. SG1]